jgi:hypothetical protein
MRARWAVGAARELREESRRTRAGAQRILAGLSGGRPVGSMPAALAFLLSDPGNPPAI